MTLDEREQFLADVHVGVVAVERPGRAPLAVPIWYGYEPGGEVLVWGGLATLAFGALGMMASQRLDRLAGYSVVASSGTLLAAIAPTPV